jgi:hypothetical protein
MNFGIETRVDQLALSNPVSRRVLEPADVSAEVLLKRLLQNSEAA